MTARGARKRLAPAALLAFLLLAACERPETPREGLEALLLAVEEQDPLALLSRYDRDSQGFYAARLREWRARIAAGEAAEKVLEDERVTAEDVLDGTEQEVTGRFILRFSELATRADWVRGARVAEEVPEPGAEDSQVLMVLEGPDGSRMRLWFVRGGDRWFYDHYRTQFVEGNR